MTSHGATANLSTHHPTIHPHNHPPSSGFSTIATHNPISHPSRVVVSCSSERWFCSDVMEKSQPIKWFYVALCRKTKTIRGFAPPPVRVGSGAKRPAKTKTTYPPYRERTWLGRLYWWDKLVWSSVEVR